VAAAVLGLRAATDTDRRRLRGGRHWRGAAAGTMLHAMTCDRTRTGARHMDCRPPARPPLARPASFAVWAALLLASPAHAAAVPAPEVSRPPATAQADGVEHTLRRIPEACVRLQGRFTGSTPPYALEVVPTGPGCQPRARFEGIAGAPTAAAGWRLNDVIRVPSAGCPGLAVVLTIWRKPGQGGALGLDAQGRARIVLREAMHGQVAGMIPEAYLAQFALDGTPCRP
jgi:hypothetical protein